MATSAYTVAKKLGFLDQSVEQTSAQQGAGIFDFLGSLFGGSLASHPQAGGHISLGITKKSYDKACRLHKMHGGGFMDWVKKVGKVAKSALPMIAAALPGKYGVLANAANSIINPAQSGEGLYLGHKHYKISKAHYDRAVRHHRQNGGGFWDSIKSVAKKVASVAIPLAKQFAPMLPGKAGIAANMALNMLEPPQDGSGVLKKGSAEAKARMAHLRSLRKKNKGAGLY